MKRRTAVSLGLGLILVMMLSMVGVCAGAARERHLSLATGSQGGTYYPVGVGIAQIITDTVKGLVVEPEVTGAAIDNVILVGTGEAQMGIATAEALYQGTHGLEPFRESYKNIRVMFSGLQPGAMQVATLESSGIKSIRDLKGKRVALGPQGGSGWKNFALLLEFYGMTIKDFKTTFVSYEESINQLKDGNVDAAVILAGIPTSAIKELGVRHRFRLIQIEPDILEAFMKKYPYYQLVDIEPSVYGLREKVTTFATINMVIVNSLVDKDTVYEATRAVFENLDKLHRIHPAAQAITLKTATSYKGHPYHPGAAAYFREKGIEVPEE
ncbi:MAG: TAXI family TRAP transporter solute-binding subunit [Firmicutes bacterium]|nr:TAXI family TRAP transporter solute-binding subunit [Bacillota bacterium]